MSPGTRDATTGRGGRAALAPRALLGPDRGARARRPRATRRAGGRPGRCRVGRAIDNDVVLDDPHVAPHHAP
ncbi:MAG: FHA domain-containing protein [Comamonadaceae bacterium]|nr:FHA domain-containing protein [Comamonadaceae bacterium]